MKRLLLLGTLMAVASFATGCMTCGYRTCGIGPVVCQTTCEPCAVGVACPTKYVSPYAGMYYSGDECGTSCGGCAVSCGDCAVDSYRPFARLCNLVSGNGSCGCACEKYYGDYINHPPSLCNPCDQFGGLAGFSAKCPTGSCDPYMTTSYASMSYGSMSQPIMAQPISQPAMMISPPTSGCKDCNQGNTFYTNNQPRPQVVPQPMPQSQPVMMARQQPQRQQAIAQPMQQPVMVAQTRQAIAPPAQKPVMQDKLVAGNSQQVNYRMYPVRQVSNNANDQFGTSSRVIQPAIMPADSRVVHAN